MYSLKLLGALLIIGVGGATALLCRKREKRRLCLLEGWIDLIRHVRGQIDCYLLPLDEIFSAVRLDTKEDMPTGEQCLRAILRQGQGDLDSESLRLLRGFVDRIGRGYREDQVRLCDEILTALCDLRDRRAAQLPARLRVSTALCLCGAIGGALLLW